MVYLFLSVKLKEIKAYSLQGSYKYVGSHPCDEQCTYRGWWGLLNRLALCSAKIVYVVNTSRRCLRTLPANETVYIQQSRLRSERR